MKKKIAITLLILLISLVIVVASSWIQKSSLKKYIKAVPKGTYFVDVVIEASKIPFAKVSLEKTRWWAEENSWIPPSIEIELNTLLGSMYCNIDYFDETTTGEWSCSSYYDLLP